MRVVLHIGTHTSGAAAVQQACFNAAAALKARGILYPRTHLIRQGHHPLGFAAAGGEGAIGDLDAILADYLQQARATGAETLLLSSEQFANLNAGAAGVLLERLSAAAEVTVACYLRPPVQHILCDYKNKVRALAVRFTGSAADYVNGLALPGGLDYASIVQRWAVPGVSLRLKAWDPGAEPEGADIVTDLFKLCDLGQAPVHAPPTPEPRNLTTLITLAVNRLGAPLEMWLELDGNIRSEGADDVELLEAADRARIIEATRPAIDRLLAGYDVVDGERLREPLQAATATSPARPILEHALAGLIRTITPAHGPSFSGVFALDAEPAPPPADRLEQTQRATTGQMLRRAGLTGDIEMLAASLQRQCTVIPQPKYGRFQYDLPDDYVYEEVRRLFERERSGIEGFFSRIGDAYRSPHLKRITNHEVDQLSPYWKNGFFGRGDGSMLYATVATWRPRQVLEVGVGNSTRFVRRAIQDYGLETHIRSIDPSPRANISGVTDEHIQKSVLDVDLETFDSLDSGDILFLDASHVSLPGTDVPHYMLNILPRLKPGVLVHIHDIALPEEYPARMRRRQYNEQHMLAAMLLFTDRWRVLMPITWAAKEKIVPYIGGSIWIERL